VGELLGQGVPPAPTEGPVDAPGMSRYELLQFREILRRYQKEGVLFLIRRAYALLALPMRSGKCLVALAADVAIDSRWTLIIAPSLVKWVWADEVWKWCKTEALILEGRGGREARQYCGACEARGELADGTWCPSCKQLNGQSYGYNIYEVRTVSKPVRAPQIDLPKPRRARKKHKWKYGPQTRMNLLRQPKHGPMYPRRIDIAKMKEERKRINKEHDDGRYQCSKHPEVVANDPKLLCLLCRQELLERIKNARYIIANYDILAAQDLRDEAGGLLGARLDLPGWAPLLEFIQFDTAILDESHVVRGRPQKKRRGRTRRDRLIDALRNVLRVWLLTGTPIYGYTRDLWSQFDIASDGLFGKPWYDCPSSQRLSSSSGSVT
jgi:hypothetical protein